MGWLKTIAAYLLLIGIILAIEILLIIALKIMIPIEGYAITKMLIVVAIIAIPGYSLQFIGWAMMYASAKWAWKDINDNDRRKW